MAELVLENVKKCFGDQVAVNNLSLQIRQGEFVALLGPSGCGKTTTLRMLAGFESLSSGAIHLGGRRLADARSQLAPEDRNMGMVFQSYALWPHMTVAENIAFPLKMRRVSATERQRRVRDALEVVQLEPYATRFPKDLSGGQRQRVALARCLVTEPDVVLLDEPLANLDRHLRASMEASFRDFHRRTGATMIYVTHDQSEAMSLADRVAVMSAGELVQWATPDALYHQPRSQWLAEFIGQGSVISVANMFPATAGLLSCDQLNSALASHEDSHSTDRVRPVLVRPQHISLGTGSLSATAELSVFRGERYEVGLRLDNGEQMLAYHDRPLAPGTRTAFSIRQGWCVEAAC